MQQCEGREVICDAVLPPLYNRAVLQGLERLKRNVKQTFRGPEDSLRSFVNNDQMPSLPECNVTTLLEAQSLKTGLWQVCYLLP